MLSHDACTWPARASAEAIKITPNDDCVSYLPLSHAFAQMSDIWVPMYSGAAVYFANRNALKGSLVETLREVRPAFLFGVPRVFEKIQETMVEMGKNASFGQRMISSWAKSAGLSHNLKSFQEEGHSEGFSYTIAKKLVFGKVKERLGFDRCRLIGVGAAPLAMDTLEYFLSLDIPMYEGYGMSETMGPHTANYPGTNKLGTVGLPLKGLKASIFRPDHDGTGEAILYGRNIMMGYLFREKETKEAIDDDGWLHSGDMGKLSNEYLIITGRIKELIITAGGENVPHTPIEDRIRKQLPCVSNAMLIGDGRKFLSCLLTLRVDVDPDSQEPTERLSPPALKWCEDVGSVANTVQEALADSAVKAAIQDGINNVNGEATSNAQKVQKWCLLPVDFSLPGGELGPTLKLKRHYVLQKYEAEIKKLYAI